MNEHAALRITLRNPIARARDDLDCIPPNSATWGALRGLLSEWDALTAEVERLRTEHKAENMAWRAAIQGAKNAGLRFASERDQALAQLAEAGAEIDRLRVGHDASCIRCATSNALIAERDVAQAQLAAEKARADGFAKERDEWADAIRTVAPGCIASPFVARTAIGHLKALWESEKARADEAEAARDQAMLVGQRVISECAAEQASHDTSDLQRQAARDHAIAVAARVWARTKTNRSSATYPEDEALLAAVESAP